MDCGESIAKYYDDLITCNNGPTNKMDHKRAIWMAMMSANALEGVRFYVSFACSWAFAELKKMEGNAKIIKLIARDENVHLASTTTMLKLLKKEDKDFEKIAKELEPESIKLYEEVINQEKDWAKYFYDSKGEKIEGNLSIKGTVDLITKVSENTLYNISCPFLTSHFPQLKNTVFSLFSKT